jgi:SAM-dependent methyltransferase
LTTERLRLLATELRSKLRRKKRGGGAVSGLRSQWSAYPKLWREDKSLNLGFTTLGEEWGGPKFADAIVERLAAEYLGPDVDVLELGCGGGKFSRRIAPRVRSLVCADISAPMLEQTRNELARQGDAEGVEFCQLSGIDFHGIPDSSVDFIFSYDVQLHMQPQNIFSYMLDARRILRPGGTFMLHQINLDSPGGIDQFQSQFLHDTWDQALDSPRRLGHIYFMSRDQMSALAEAAGMKLERLVDDFPGRDDELWGVTRDRDIFGFMRPLESRLGALKGTGARLLKATGSEMIWVVLPDGTRAAIQSADQFERAGFAWSKVEVVSEAELAGIAETQEPLKLWE